MREVQVERSYLGNNLNANDLKHRGLVVHAWTDYVPQSFIEIHPALLRQSEFSSQNLVWNLWDNGKAVDPYTVYSNKKSLADLTNPSLIHRIQTRLSRHWTKIDFLNFFRQQLEKLKPSLVHSHFGTTACELSPILHQLGIPHIVTFYGYDISAALNAPDVIQKYQKLFETAARLVVLCSTARERLVNLGCSPEKIVVWNLPAGIEKYPYGARTPQSTTRLLMAARFAEHKGHRYALEALHELNRQGHKVHLTLVGYGNGLSKIRKMASFLRIDESLSIIDNQLRGDFDSQFRLLLEQNDIFILPTTTDRHGTDEGGPALTLVCAQSAGLPVVCTDFPGSEISVFHGETGFICEDKSSISLAREISKLIEQPELRNRFGRLGSRIVQNNFAQISQTSAMCRLYQQVINRDAGPKVALTSPFLDDNSK